MANNAEIQRNIIEAVQTIVKAEINNNTTTKSVTGYVVSEPTGFECVVSISGQEYTCQLPEHLHTWIQKDDVVIIHDLYGDGVKKVVAGKTGSRQTSPSLVFFDEDKGKNVSGRDMLFDENGSKLDKYGTV